MKRTASTLILLAGFGGGCATSDGGMARKPTAPGGYGTVTRAKEIPGVQGPGGEPVAMTAARGAMPGSAGGAPPATAVNAMGVKPAGGVKTDGGVVQAHLPGQYTMGPAVRPVNYDQGGPPRGGILPVPGMGPPGAVAAGPGVIIPGMRPPMTNQRSSIRFTGPAGMKVTWQLPGGGFNDETTGLTAPKEYNFLQGQVYRLRLTQLLPNFPGKTFYPTLEVSPVTPKTITFLAHASVPVTFTDEDFKQAAEGNLVVKVIYLPDPTFQDFATIAGAEEIVSTRLEPGADPVAEAQRRGTILGIIRLGNIDLENRASPAMTAPPGGLMGPPPVMMMPGGPMPGGPRPGAGGPPPITIPGGPGASIAPLPALPNVPSPTAPTVAPPSAKPTAPAAPIAPGPLPPSVGSGSGSSNAKPTTLPPIK